MTNGFAPNRTLHWELIDKDHQPALLGYFETNSTGGFNQSPEVSQILPGKYLLHVFDDVDNDAHSDFVGKETFTTLSLPCEQNNNTTSAQASGGSGNVSITVNPATPVNTPPVAKAQSVTTNRDTAASINLDATDKDGDSLTYSLGTSPNHVQSLNNAKVDAVSTEGNPGRAISPGHSFTYEFVAESYGVYPYSCRVDPVADSINRGLYGMMIVDPKKPRPHMTEMVMMLNGYDMNYEQEANTSLPPASQFPINQRNDTDSNITQMSFTSLSSMKQKEIESPQDKERDNEIYSVNGKAFDYVKHPIMLQTGKLYRIYVANMLEFDSVNSFQIDGTMFDYYTAGTDETSDYKTDIITMSHGDRGIMEFMYGSPGTYLFQSSQTEYTDLGWMGLFDVRGDPVNTNITDIDT